MQIPGREFALWRQGVRDAMSDIADEWRRQNKAEEKARTRKWEGPYAEE